MHAESTHAAQVSVAPHTASTLPPALSQAKLDANRANAKQSTGPRTPEGKARSSRNAVKFGMFCRDLEAASPTLEDDREELAALLEDLTATYQPEGEEEARIVDRIVAGWWRLRRLSSHAQRRLTQRLTDGTPAFDAVLESEAIGPMEARIETSLSRLHRHLVSRQRYRRDRIRQGQREAVASMEAELMAEQMEMDLYLRSLRQQQRDEKRAERSDRETVPGNQQAEPRGQRTEPGDRQVDRGDRQPARHEQSTARHTEREQMSNDPSSYAQVEAMEESGAEFELESQAPASAEPLIRSAA